MRRGLIAVPAALLLVIIGFLVGHNSGSSSRHRTPRAPSKAPAEVPARLLPLREPDPGGGAPWGIRLASTRDGFLCAQVGRVADGTLGQLGIDGAFADDHVFHAFPGNSFAQVRVPGTVGNDADCVATKETFSGTIDGLDRNAEGNPEGDGLPLVDRREIAFGLLGPHALEVSYRDGEQTVHRPVLRGLGAFLVVRAARHIHFLGSTGAAPGSDYSDDLDPAGPTGFIVAITYRFGKTVCHDNGHQPIARCHLSDRPLGNELTPSQKGY